MRTKQAFKNALTSFLLQATLAVSGFLISRMFIALYGSPVNGLVSSISQFITYMGLVEAGIGAAGTVALYRPLALKDREEVNAILSAAKGFYLRSGWIFAALLALLVLLYPYKVRSEINDLAFIRTMIVLLALNGVVDYFYLGKFRVLLQADQHGYVISLIQVIGTVVMTVVCMLMMHVRCSALLVKAVNAGVYLLRSAAVGLYVRRRYPWAKFNVAPKNEAFSQRWAALVHQIAGMVVNNTDIILLTLLLTANALSEVSVYSVYMMVAYALYGLMSAITNGLGAGFGEVISKGETEVLKRSFSSFEYAFFLIIFIATSCMASLLHPFIDLYSARFTDGVQYLRWPLVALFSCSVLLQSLRLPGLTILCAAGHYKQTEGRAVAEAAINLGVSIALIFPLGINGVLLGTCVSYLYRSTDVILYSAKHFTPGSLKTTLRRLVRNGLTAGALIALGIRFIPAAMTSWGMWLLCAAGFGIVSSAVLIGVNWLFEPQEFCELFARAKSIVARKG